MGQDPPSRKAARRAAKLMSLFVAAFFVQWWSTGLYGAWELFERAPDFLLHTCTIFPNIGGALNLGVYVLINRNRHVKGRRSTARASRSHDSNGFVNTRKVNDTVSTLS